MSDKTCTDCGQIAPDTEANFRRRRDGTMDARCLVCRAKVNRGKKKKQKASDMKAIEDGAVSTFLSSATRGGENIPHSSELLERLMDYFGGSSGFAAMMVKQYFDAPPGGSHRTKLLEGIVRLVTKNTELGGAKKPLAQWTDEEIESELDARLRRIAVSFEGRLLDVEVTPQTPSDFAATFGQALGHIPAGRVEGDAGGTGDPPDRSLEVVPANAAAGGSPQEPSERDSGAGGQS
jgi:hypothetical protein